MSTEQLTAAAIAYAAAIMEYRIAFNAWRVGSPDEYAEFCGSATNPSTGRFANDVLPPCTRANQARIALEDAAEAYAAEAKLPPPIARIGDKVTTYSADAAVKRALVKP